MDSTSTTSASNTATASIVTPSSEPVLLGEESSQTAAGVTLSDEANTSSGNVLISSSTSPVLGEDRDFLSIFSNATNSSSSAAANITTFLSQSLGFCYSCNRQNRINANDFTCTVCNSGFIEITNETDAM